MTLPAFLHSSPFSLEEVVTAMRRGATPYCGGTELLAAMKMGLLHPAELVSLRRIDQLRGIASKDGSLQIGAATTHAQIADSEVVRECVPLLCEVADGVGNVRVRSTGTIGGNIAFAEPRSDILPVLFALGAEVHVGDGAAERCLPITELVAGPYETHLDSGELLLRVDISLESLGTSVYRRIAVGERPTVGICLVHDLAAEAWRLTGAAGGEIHLAEFKGLDDIGVDDVAAALDVVPGLDGSEDYKQHLARVCTERAREDARNSFAKAGR